MASEMTDAQRREAILKIIKKKTEKMTVSKATARKALIDEGIYTQKGKLRAEFGGGRKKSKSAA